MTHVMLDLETWGKRPGCDIRSIGAVVFDPLKSYVAIPCGDENNDVKSFYIATDNPTRDTYDFGDAGFYPHTGERFVSKYPLTRDPETVKWWDDQSPEAQAAFADPVDLRDALEGFSSWFESLATATCWSHDIKLWANDPHFDVSILEAAYHAVGLPVPWHYRAPRSMKTATDLAGLSRDEYCNYGTGHHALHDAIAQAQTVCKCYERLGLTGE